MKDISIDKSQYPGKNSYAFGTPWIVRCKGGENRREEASIHLEVKHDFSGDPDTITRVLMWQGDRYVVETDEEFDAHIEAYVEHEDATKAQARDELEKRFMSYRQASHLCAVKKFDEMEAAWHALNCFVDFGIAGH